ncbi:MAG: Type IV fimbrial assembly protein PilC [Parcubacteria bacterium C7867-002]|nr:MAG: Type IV fimbrial assembly protein PilC [Parcubacteria bacterium C7867-002]
MKIPLFSLPLWNRRDTIFLLERLELYLVSGLRIDHAFTVMSERMSPKKKQSLEAVRQVLERGGSLSTGLGEHVRLPGTIVALIGHGELSGELISALKTARLIMERESELIKTCLSAMAYPFIIALFAGLLTLGLLRGVMPQIIPMLKSLNVALPLLTRVVIVISDGLLSYGLYILGMIFMGPLTLMWVYRRYEFLRSITHRLLIQIPIIGKVVLAYHLSLFFRSVGALVETGVSIAVSYPRVCETITLIPLHRLFQGYVSEIQRGISLGAVLRHAYIPDYVPQLVVAGERSGTLGLSLGRVAALCDRDIEHALKRITALIEPVMMIGVGCMVGAIALSIMMPIYDISKVLQK